VKRVFVDTSAFFAHLVEEDAHHTKARALFERADPTENLQQSRASDFTRLFRLGYHHKPGDFRELATPYYSVAEAVHAAGKLNAQRYTRGVALLDTVTVYIRLDYVSFRPDPDKEVP
jgi:hypothetical protein